MHLLLKKRGATWKSDMSIWRLCKDLSNLNTGIEDIYKVKPWASPELSDKVNVIKQSSKNGEEEKKLVKSQYGVVKSEGEEQQGVLDKKLIRNTFLTPCVCVFLSVYEHLLCFRSALSTSKHWFRLNSLSLALSAGKRLWLRFTWLRSTDFGVHLPYNHRVSVFVMSLYSVVINSLRYSPWFLSCLLRFHRIKNIVLWVGFFSYIMSENQYIYFPCITNCLGFF